MSKHVAKDKQASTRRRLTACCLNEFAARQCPHPNPTLSFKVALLLAPNGAKQPSPGQNAAREPSEVPPWVKQRIGFFALKGQNAPFAGSRQQCSRMREV